MKDNFVHVCFVIDESGSMYSSVNDVVGGFKKVLDEQLAVKDGTCAVSLYKFNSIVKELYIGRDIKKVVPLSPGENAESLLTILNSTSASNDEITYSPGGGTAMNDGIGRAIDNIGKWLAAMPEEERPMKNLIVVMTDGEENSSHEYSGQKVREMIEHQETKYNWTFIYMGTDITTTKAADSLGFKNQAYNVRSKLGKSYDSISNTISSIRSMDVKGLGVHECACAIDNMVSNSVSALNAEYLADTGLDMSKSSTVTVATEKSSKKKKKG